MHLAALSIALAIVTSPGDETFIHEPTNSYRRANIAGYRVMISQAVQQRPDELNPALALLREQLEEINRLIPQDALTILKTIPFWIEADNPDFPCACYHVSVDWLRENGYNTDKRRSVEISNPKNYMAWVNLNQPYMTLHELAHGYHDIRYGYDHPYILACYRLAVASKKYESVPHNRGGERRAYALNNQMEYFAELTEAYFGENDFYPFNRAQLKEFDPAGYEMIKRMWRVSPISARRP
jgi:hypothetical protein